MRLFFYYVLHSFVNQLKKLFKSWILIFILVCALIGGVVGYMGSQIAEVAESNEEVLQESVESEDGDIQEILEDGAIDDVNSDIDDEAVVPSLTELAGLETNDMLELIMGLVILVILFFFLFNADKSGSKIFQPADVVMLFTSPMKPQAVLMFRVVTQMGMMLFITLYMLLQIPNLVVNVGLSVVSALSLLLVWFFTLVYGSLLQTLLYTAASSNAAIKKYLRPVIYTVLALVAIGYAVSFKLNGSRLSGVAAYLAGADAYFNQPVTCWIPIWGWLKGVSMFLVEGELVKCLVCIGLIVLSYGLIIFGITRTKPAFYEDAMAKSEERAAILAAAQSEKSNNIIKQRKKDRGDSIDRDGMNHGFGASVFFFKSMYNRFRFAHLHVFTKTMETYLVAAVGSAAIFRFVGNQSGDTPMMIIILILSGLCFFRAMGNSLEEDTNMDWFALIPDSIWKKLGWSLLACLVNCVLDLLPAVIIGALMVGGNLLSALLWTGVSLSLFFYATTVGVFINLTVPQQAGKNIKQFVQILFIYFGLLPDIAVTGFGLALKYTTVAAWGAIFINTLLGIVFFIMCPGFIKPRHSLKRRISHFEGNLKDVRRVFAWVAFSVFVMYVVTVVLQLLAGKLIVDIFPAAAANEWTLWLLSFAPFYFIAMPICYALLKRLPAKVPEKAPLKWQSLPVAFVISLFMLYAGSLISSLVNMLLGRLLGSASVNPLTAYTLNDNLVARVLVLAVLAPILEECLCRKMVIDRLRTYGEKPAILISALLFGMIHGNLYQVFYAVGVGLLYGYIYMRTGKLRYSIGLHMSLNFVGSIVGPEILKRVDLQAVANTTIGEFAEKGLWALPTSALAYGVYLIIITVCVILGLILLIIKSQSLVFKNTETEIPHGTAFKTTGLTWGMLLMIAAFGLTIVFIK